MFEPFRAAPGGAKVANILILLFLFLSWVSTMVTFGSVLHRLSENAGQNTVETSVTLDFYWDHWKISNFNGEYVSGKYSQQPTHPQPAHHTPARRPLACTTTVDCRTLTCILCSSLILSSLAVPFLLPRCSLPIVSGCRRR